MDLNDGFLLLGAGASRDAGVPTAAEFVGRIRDHLNKLASPTRDAILEEFDRVVALLTRPGGAEPGLEPFFEAIDDCLDAHYSNAESPNGLLASRALERIHYETKRVIQEQCDVRDQKRVRYLDALLPRLKAFAPFPIVSFNYDNVVETACNRNRMSFGETVLGERVSNRDIDLIKVHGSITWLPRKDGHGLERSNQYGNAIVRQFGELRSAVLETPMIYPSRRKMPIHEPFMQNALRLQNVLREKNNCLAVGYSFPDLHVRSWLTKAIEENPDFLLYIVGPAENNPAFANLFTNMPTVAWRQRMRIVDMKFGEAIKAGFESCLAVAKHFGPDVLRTSGSTVRRLNRRLIYRGRSSGMGASPDGGALYISDAANKELLKIDLETDAISVVATRLKDPRGVAVARDGRVFVVQNRLLRTPLLPTTGAGSVLEISPSHRRRSLTRFQFRDLLALAKLLRKGTRWSELRGSFRSALSWPTDVAWRARDDTVFVTEARALTRVEPNSEPERICEPELAFNLHGLDVAPDGALVGVEQGIGQMFCWGRVERFEFTEAGIRISRSVAAEGLTRLMALCFVPSRRQIVVAQTLTWPLGALLTFDYPFLDNARILRGFDFPQKVEYIPYRDLLAVNTPEGVELIPVAELDHAIPLE